MKKVVRLTETDLVRIVKRVINEQDRGFGDPKSNEGGTEFEHFYNIVKPQLIKNGFKFDYNEPLKKYGKENSLNYGGHEGVNVLWDRINGKYFVWVGNNQGMKEFKLGGGVNTKVVANNVVKYALSLKK